MSKIILVVALLGLVAALSGCIFSDVIPENPGSCEQDSDCVGVIHPAGAPMCVGRHWLEMGGNNLVRIDETMACKCIDMKAPEDITGIVGLKHNKFCGPAGLDEPVSLTTDKAVYSLDETIVVTVKNNLDRPLWFYTAAQNCWPNMELMGSANGNWERVPILPFEPMTGECGSITTKLEPGESTTLEYQPTLWHDQAFLNFASYKLGIGYTLTEGMMESLPAYSNEFSISGGLVLVSTDKTSYGKNDLILVDVENKSPDSIWFDAEASNYYGEDVTVSDRVFFYESLVLFGKRNGEWAQVSTDRLLRIPRQIREELKAGDSTMLVFYPIVFYGEQNLTGFDSFKIGFEYASSSDGQDAIGAYSNEFSIGESGAGDAFSCEADSDCVYAGQGSGLDEHPGCVNSQWWWENYGNTSYMPPSPNECACVNQRCVLKNTGNLIMYTDKGDYYESEIIEVVVHNNSARPAWYKIVDFQGCDQGGRAIMTNGPLKLERYRLFSGLLGGEWIPVPSSEDSLGEECGYAMWEMESGEFETRQHFLWHFYEAEFKTSKYDPQLTSRYRLAIEYATVNDVTKVEKAYSNEFTISHETECERIERETPGLLEEIKSCKSDSECVADYPIVSTTFAACYIIRSNQYDSSFELNRINQNLEQYAEECGGTIMAKCAPPPENLACENHKCVESSSSNGNGYTPVTYPPNTDSEEDRLAVENVYKSYIQAGQDCDIETANAIITERTKEIVRYTCSNLKNETNCYIDMEYEILTKPEIAVVYLTPFSHGIENPFFFSKENGEWKLDLYRMAFGMAMGGSTCHSGWGWISQELADEFCSYFPEGECPDN